MTAIFAPRILVRIEQPGADPLEFTAQTDNRDAVAWDMTRGRKNWPQMQDAPMLWATFCAWSALHRTGAINLKLDTFLEVCITASVLNVDDDDEDDASMVGPTQTDHESVSSAPSLSAPVSPSTTSSTPTTP